MEDGIVASKIRLFQDVYQEQFLIYTNPWTMPKISSEIASSLSSKLHQRSW